MSVRSLASQESIAVIRVSSAEVIDDLNWHQWRDHRRRQHDHGHRHAWENSFKHVTRVMSRQSFRIATIMATIATFAAVVWASSTRGFVEDELPDNMFYSCLSTLVSFFIVFRAGHAISRYMEAGGIIYSAIGDWFDMCSSLISFTRKARKDVLAETQGFCNSLVILISMLNALCLSELEGTGEEAPKKAFEYELIDYRAIPRSFLDEIRDATCKAETVYQMVQAMVVDNIDSGVLDVPAPILTRSFQEMTQAMLKYHEAEKLVKVPYPIALHAVSTVFIFVHSIVTIRYFCAWMPVWYHLAPFTFIIVFSFWIIHGLCDELEQPFHPDAGAIDLESAQCDLNERLSCLLEGWSRSPLPLRPEQSLRAQNPSRKSFVDLSRDGRRSFKEQLEQESQSPKRSRSLGSLDSALSRSSRLSHRLSHRLFGMELASGSKPEHSADSSVTSSCLDWDVVATESFHCARRHSDNSALPVVEVSRHSTASAPGPSPAQQRRVAAARARQASRDEASRADSETFGAMDSSASFAVSERSVYSSESQGVGAFGSERGDEPRAPGPLEERAREAEVRGSQADLSHGGSRSDPELEGTGGSVQDDRDGKMQQSL